MSVPLNASQVFVSVAVDKTEGMPSAVPKPGESLADLFPELAAQWHPTKNGDLTPADVVAGTNRKVWWKCDVAEDHEWEASIHPRTKRGVGCPACSGRQVASTNSLKTLFPEVAAQWHPTKNGELTPAEVVAGSQKKVWWKCDVAEDHEWLATASSRTSVSRRGGGSGCPSCSGHQLSTTNSLTINFPDVAAQWHPAKNGDVMPAELVAGTPNSYWWKCPKGDDHEWQAPVRNRTGAHGKRPTGCPCCAGKQLSATNGLVELFPEVAAEWHPTKNADVEVAEITAGSNRRSWWQCAVSDDHEWATSVANRTRNGSGCPMCLGRWASVRGPKHPALKNPRLVKEWHPTKNGKLQLDQMALSSHLKVWWKCDVADDHEWQAALGNRTRFGHGCPCCSGRQASVTNSLASLYPEVAEEWHPIRNGEITPAEVVAGSSKKFWWKCPKGDDHEWQATGDKRCHSSQGCPFCEGLQVSVTNSLASLHPELVKEWHPTKNGDLTPGDFVVGTNKMVWWKCDVAADHEWEARIQPRAMRGVGCPSCSGLQVSVTNSLVVLFPEIAADWHPTKNGDLDPAEVVAGSAKKYWWRCPVADDHEWRAMAVSRTRAEIRSGCPHCTLTPRSAQEMRLYE